jgi:transposase
MQCGRKQEFLLVLAKVVEKREFHVCVPSLESAPPATPLNWPNDPGHPLRAISFAHSGGSHARTKDLSRELKQRAASMVLDDNCSVPDVCASMDVGPTALRRWVDQVRKERQKGQPVTGTKGISDEQRELQQLRAKIKRLETEAEILKKATALLMSDPDRFS